MNSATKGIVGGVAYGALIIGAVFAAKYLKATGSFTGDVHDLMSRSIGVISGLYVVFVANSVPKTLIPLSRVSEPAFAQSLRRFIAATLCIGGLVFAGVWLLAPMSLAFPLAIASLGGAFALTVLAILVCGLSQAKARG